MSITALPFGCSSDGDSAISEEQQSAISEEQQIANFTDSIALSRLSSVKTVSDGFLPATLDYNYDNMGRLVSITAQPVELGGQAIFATKLQYEGDFLVSVDELRQSMSYTIDMGRIVSRTATNKISSENRTTEFIYDESARLVQVIDGTFGFTRGCQPGPGTGDGNYSLTWEDNRVVGIVSDAGDLSASYSYNDAGLLISRSVSRDCDNREAVERYSYDEAGRLVTIELDPGPAGTLETEERSYNENGQIVGVAIIDDQGEREELTRHVYNAAGQLESFTRFWSGGQSATVMTFEYTSDTCAEQLWTRPESSISPESETNISRAPGMPKCAYFPSLR